MTEFMDRIQIATGFSCFGFYHHINERAKGNILEMSNPLSEYCDVLPRYSLSGF
jgi:hypothetical protein